MLASREVNRGIGPETGLDPDQAGRCRQLRARAPRSPAGRDGRTRTGRRSGVRRSGCCASCCGRWEGGEGEGWIERAMAASCSV